MLKQCLICYNMEALTQEQKIKGIEQVNKACSTHPAVLNHIKTLCWWAVQYVCKIEQKCPGKTIKKEMVDQYIEAEVNLRNVEDVFNPDSEENQAAIDAFQKECIEWLEPFGYSVHSRTGSGTSLTFTNHDAEHSPAIKCWINHSGERRAKLNSAGEFKLFLSLQSGDIQFKHPDIQRYIDVMSHYAKIAAIHSPF